MSLLFDLSALLLNLPPDGGRISVVDRTLGTDKDKRVVNHTAQSGPDKGRRPRAVEPPRILENAILVVPDGVGNEPGAEI